MKIALFFTLTAFATPAFAADDKKEDKKEEKKPVDTHGHQGGKAGKAGRPTKD